MKRPTYTTDKRSYETITNIVSVLVGIIVFCILSFIVDGNEIKVPQIQFSQELQGMIGLVSLDNCKWSFIRLECVLTYKQVDNGIAANTFYVVGYNDKGEKLESYYFPDHLVTASNPSKEIIITSANPEKVSIVKIFPRD